MKSVRLKHHLRYAIAWRQWQPVKSYSVALLIALSLGMGYSTAQPLPERWTLRGRVVDPDGKPINNAAVTLIRGDRGAAAAYWGGSTVTNVQGEFLFLGVEEGSYLVQAQEPRALSSGKTQFQFNAPTRQVEVIIRPPAQLRILKPDGQPLTNAMARLLMVVADVKRDRGGRAIAITSGRTDAQGHTSLNASFNIGRFEADGDLVTMVLVTVPGIGVGFVPEIPVLDRKRPLEVQLQQGGTLCYVAQEKNTDGETIKEARFLGGASPTLELLPTPNEENTGPAAANTIDENRLATFYKYLGTRNLLGPTISITADSSGAGEVRELMPGTYKVMLSLTGYKEPISQTVQVEAGKVTDVNYVLEPVHSPATVEVLLTNQQGQLIADTEFLFQMNRSDRPEGGPEDSIQYRRVRTDAKGQTTMYPVQAGRWNITFYAVSPPRTLSRTTTTVVRVGGGSSGKKVVNIEAPVTSITLEADSNRP